MNLQDIIQLRLMNQQMVKSRFKKPEQIVSWLGAVQAQDYPGGLWGVGLRMENATEQMVEKAVIDKKIVRTWPMRGTLHFVAAEDARWMLDLMAKRIMKRMEYYTRPLGLDDTTFLRSRKLLTKALQGGNQLTRPVLYEILEKGGITTSKSRGLHILGRLSHEGVLIFGSREGKQHTFALMDEWILDTHRMQQEEALAEITRRYMTSHGPATAHDFMWWSGLTAKEVRTGLDLNKKYLTSEEIDGKTYWFAKSLPRLEDMFPLVHLIPPYDEYLISYKDRTAALDAEHYRKIVAGGNGVFGSTVIANGRGVGTWKRIIQKDKVIVSVKYFFRSFKADADALEDAVQEYGRFLGLPAKLS